MSVSVPLTNDEKKVANYIDNSAQIIIDGQIDSDIKISLEKCITDNKFKSVVTLQNYLKFSQPTPKLRSVLLKIIEDTAPSKQLELKHGSELKLKQAQDDNVQKDLEIEALKNKVRALEADLSNAQIVISNLEVELKDLKFRKTNPNQVIKYTDPATLTSTMMLTSTYLHPTVVIVYALRFKTDVLTVAMFEPSNLLSSKYICSKSQIVESQINPGYTGESGKSSHLNLTNDPIKLEDIQDTANSRKKEHDGHIKFISKIVVKDTHDLPISGIKYDNVPDFMNVKSAFCQTVYQQMGMFQKMIPELGSPIPITGTKDEKAEKKALNKRAQLALLLQNKDNCTALFNLTNIGFALKLIYNCYFSGGVPADELPMPVTVDVKSYQIACDLAILCAYNEGGQLLIDESLFNGFDPATYLYTEPMLPIGFDRKYATQCLESRLIELVKALWNDKQLTGLSEQQAIFWFNYFIKNYTPEDLALLNAELPLAKLLFNKKSNPLYLVTEDVLINNQDGNNVTGMIKVHPYVRCQVGNLKITLETQMLTLGKKPVIGFNSRLDEFYRGDADVDMTMHVFDSNRV